MIKRLEQVAALVVTAGLAIVSYWLFFSWAQGGSLGKPPQRSRLSQAPAGLQQPLLARTVVQGGDVGFHLGAGYGQVLPGANRHDAL